MRISQIPLIYSVAIVLLSLSSVEAQTDIHITGPKAGFPVAVPQLCDAGGGAPATARIAEVISKDLTLSGMFNVINPSTFVESPGKCATEGFAFTDWSVIGAEGLVRGEVRQTSGSTVEVKMFLYDVLQQRAVLGKQYQAEIEDATRIAHRFANEIMYYFTGEKGIFGTRIAYVSRVGRFKELFLMDLDGSNVRQLTKDRGLVSSPSWSPSGDRIIFTSYRSRRPELYVISPDGGSSKQLTSSEVLKIGAEFSPDGGKIITSISNSGDSNIFLLDLRGKVLSQLTRGNAIDVSPTYSPDGSRIAFCSNRGGGPQIYVMGAQGGEAKRVSFTNSNYCTSPAWSPKGDKIAFICLSGGHQVFLVSPDGGAASQLTYSGNNEDPVWSPDGRYLAFSSTAGGRGGGRNIMMMSLVSGSQVQLSFTKSEDSAPAWSPRVE